MLTIFRYFHETAQSGSIRRASEVLNVSPSSVSRQILVLERMFGTSLFERSASGVGLTHAGRLVDEFVRAMLLDYETLRNDIDDLRGAGRAVIRIGVIESMATGAVLTTLQGFRARFPNVTFRLLVLTASAVTDAVRTGACDLGITLGPPADIEIRTLCDVAEPLLLAVPPGHRFASRASVAMTDLVDEPLAAHEVGHGLRRLIDQACRSHGFNFSPVLSSSSLQALREFVRNGYGGAILTRRGAGDAAARGELMLVPIDEPLLDAGRIAVTVRRDRRPSRILRLFVDELMENLLAEEAPAATDRMDRRIAGDPVRVVAAGCGEEA